MSLLVPQLPKEVRDDFYFGDLDDFTYLGEFHWCKPLLCDGHDDGGGPGLHGYIQPHLRPNGVWCAGAVTLRGHGTGSQHEWDLLSLEPLHLEPSLLCRAPVYPLDAKGIRITENGPTGECGDHGFIRDGKWVTA